MTSDRSNSAGENPVDRYVDPAYTLEQFRKTLASIDDRLGRLAKRSASLRKRVAANAPTATQLLAATEIATELQREWTESESSDLWYAAEILKGSYVVSDDGTEMVTPAERDAARKREAIAPAPVVVKDVLAEARSIAHRAANRPEIDWLEEPSTDRERKVRRAILDRICCERTATGALLSLWSLLPSLTLTSDASDWTEAYTRMRSIADRKRDDEARRQLDDALEAIDEGEAT